MEHISIPTFSQTEEFEIPCDEIATIYLKKNIIHKVMIQFF